MSTFFISAIDEGELLDSHPSRFTQRKQFELSFI